jgi:hypothetical protein
VHQSNGPGANDQNDAARPDTGPAIPVKTAREWLYEGSFLKRQNLPYLHHIACLYCHFRDPHIFLESASIFVPECRAIGAYVFHPVQAIMAIATGDNGNNRYSISHVVPIHSLSFLLDHSCYLVANYRGRRDPFSLLSLKDPDIRATNGTSLYLDQQFLVGNARKIQFLYFDILWTEEDGRFHENLPESILAPIS